MIKEPWKAVFLSLLLPGAGQMYADSKSRGIIFIFIYCLLYVFLLSGIFGFLFFEDAQTSRLCALIPIISIAGFIIFGIYVLFDAYKLAKTYNLDHQLTIEKDIKKKPWLAVFLSIIFPGIGQIYNNQIIKGIAFIVGAIILYIVTEIFYALSLLWIPLSLFALKDAFDSAERINSSRRKFLQQETRFVKIFVIAIIVLNCVPIDEIIKTNAIQAYSIPAGSMLPTLEIGDHILVSKTVKDIESIKRGDIVVFKYPDDPKKDFIKRVVAIGGDKIESRNKITYLNGKKIKEPYVQHTDDAIFPHDFASRDNFEPIVVPEDEFFVLGDNRDQSHDSRFWGFVPQENIKGKARKIYWSWDGYQNKVRWNRIGMTIR